MSSRVREYLPVVVLAAVAAAVSWWSSHAVFPALSWNRDEPVYLWQLETLRAGHFATPDLGLREFFHPWLSASRDGTLFSQYTLGWPLVLWAGRAAFGTAAAGLAFGAALAVTGTYAFARTLLRDHGDALVAAAMMALSPIVVVQGGVYLGYLFTLGVGLCFAAAFVSGVRDRSPRRLVAAGLFLGYVFLTRPFDMILWAAAIGGPIVVARLRARQAIAGAVGWCAVGAFPLVALTLAYNQRMTGSFTTFPVTVKDPLDTYGFGVRRIMPEFADVDYGIVTAVKGTLKNGFYLLLFVTGGVVALPVAVLGFWRRRRDAMVLPLLALLVAFPAGYFFFWGTNVSSLTSRISGPIYFVPMYAPLCIFIAVVIGDAVRLRRTAGILLAVVLVAAGLPTAINRIVTNHRISEAQEPWRDASDAVAARPDDSLVFVADSGPYLMFLNPYSANAPDLDGHVVWATDRGGENIDLIERMSDRAAFRMQASFRGDELGPDEHPKRPEVNLLPLDVVTADEFEVRATVTNPTDSPIVVATIWIDGTVVQRTLSESSRRGQRHELVWSLTLDAASDSGSRLVLDHGTVAIGAGFGDSLAAAAPTVRQEVPYRLADESVSLLLPARAERLVDIGGPILRWRPTIELPEVVLSGWGGRAP